MRLVACFIPFFTLIRQFQLQPNGDIDLVSTRLDTALNSARQQAEAAGHSRIDVDEALFAVLAWADEALLAADWSESPKWQRNLLQRRYFGIQNAGVAFFGHLDGLRPEQEQVREIYYLCMAMGFSGRHGHDRNQAALNGIKRTHLDILLPDGNALANNRGPDKPVFPDGYGPPLPRGTMPRQRAGFLSVRFQPFTLTALILPLAALLALYGVYHVLIDQFVNEILPQIRI
jgi:type VI secretion system protein ImpK